jgi:hypothetical protein
MDLPEELAREIEGRAGWSAEGPVAVYEPAEGGYRATVREIAMPDPKRRHERWVASVAVGGVAVWSALFGSARTAVEQAEKVKPRP